MDLITPNKHAPTTVTFYEMVHNSNVQLRRLPRSILFRWRQARRRTRGAVYSTWIRIWGGTVGHRLMLDPGVDFRNPPNKKWHIGHGVYIGRNTILDIQPNAELKIGNNTKIMHQVIIGAERSITIGHNVLIAESVSIRDGNHGVARTELITSQDIEAVPVEIGDDCWIGRGSAVLKGAKLGKGAVLGANSVTTRNIPQYSIAVGSPAVVKRYRE